MLSPFAEIPEIEQKKLYDLLGVHIYKYTKNEEILYTLKSKSIIGIVISGSAQIIYIEYSGNEIILENLEPNSVFGTNISPINNANCQIIAKENTDI